MAPKQGGIGSRGHILCNGDKTCPPTWLPWAIAECLLVYKQVGGSMLIEDMFEHACEVTQDMLGWGAPSLGCVSPSHCTHTPSATARTHTHTRTAGCALSGCLIIAWCELCTVNYALSGKPPLMGKERKGKFNDKLSGLH